MGQCQTQFIGDATCDGSCPPGQSCQDCQCVGLTSVNGFQLIQSGAATFTGPQTISVQYQLYSSGNVRLFAWDTINGGASSSGAFLTANNLIAPQNRPLTEIITAVRVLNNNQFQFGSLISSPSGNIVVTTSASLTGFTSGTNLAVSAGTIQWSTTLL